MSIPKSLSPAVARPSHVAPDAVYDFDFFADPGMIEWRSVAGRVYRLGRFRRTGSGIRLRHSL